MFASFGDGEKVFKTLGKASQAISPSNKLGPAGKPVTNGWGRVGWFIAGARRGDL